MDESERVILEQFNHFKNGIEPFSCRFSIAKTYNKFKEMRNIKTKTFPQNLHFLTYTISSIKWDEKVKKNNNEPYLI